MMNIGEFAALTGLTIRALRFYDEQGILTPAEVTPASRYRRYTAEQLPRAMKLAALRRADLPLPEVEQILDGQAVITDVIATQRIRLEDEHTRQLTKLSELEMLATFETQAAAASAAAAPVTVEERPLEPCHWVAHEFVFDEAAIARAQELGAEMLAGDGPRTLPENPDVTIVNALTADGNPPIGPSWVSLELGDNDTAPRVLTCWPVARSVPDGWTVPGSRTVTGQLEAGRELVARGPYAGLSVFEQMGQLPGVVAVLREAERRGLEVDLQSLRAIRPDLPMPSYEGPTDFEMAIPVSGPDGRTRRR